MTRKKMRNQLAKQFNKSIPFVVRHKIANKLCQTYSSIDCTSIDIESLILAEIPYTEIDGMSIEIYGVIFPIVIDRDWDDDIEEYINVRCINLK